MKKENLIALLKKEMVVAMGCTEPAASALTGNKAAELLGCQPEKIVAYASRDMVKNTMAVGIPNCDEHGLLTAVCLGICSENPVKDLSILSTVTEQQRVLASKLMRSATLQLVDGVPPVYVRVAVFAGSHSASCTISSEHEHISELIKDGEVLFHEDPDTTTRKANDFSKVALSLDLAQIVEFAKTVGKDQVRFVLSSAHTNMDLAKYSLQHGCGLQIAGTVLSDIPEKPSTLSEAMTTACAYAAAASDARMSGCPRQVIINSGSGNQGITCTVPMLILTDYLGCGDDKCIEAICISELVGLMITARKNRLSALCGAFTAAIGTGCGMVHLMGGSIEQMNLVVRTLVSNLSGIVCDGAKTSCALKIYSSLQAACLAVRMAFNGKAPGHESGIVGKDAMDSIDNLMDMCHEGMVQTDQTILSIMLDKNT